MSAPRMSDGDWGPVKGTVLQLRSDRKSLPQILRIVSTPLFQPSERQLRRALARWAKEDNVTQRMSNGGVVAGASSLELIGTEDTNYNQNGTGLGGTAEDGVLTAGESVGNMGTQNANEKVGDATNHKSALESHIPQWTGEHPFEWKAADEHLPYYGEEHLHGPQMLLSTADYHLQSASDSFDAWEYTNNDDEGSPGEYGHTH